MADTPHTSPSSTDDYTCHFWGCEYLFILSHPLAWDEVNDDRQHTAPNF
jgi:hypothetical protein